MNAFFSGRLLPSVHALDIPACVFAAGKTKRPVVLVYRSQLGQKKFLSNADVSDYLEVAGQRGLRVVQEDLYDELLEFAQQHVPRKTLYHIGSQVRADGAGGVVTKCLSRGEMTVITDFRWPPEPHIMAMFSEEKWLFEWQS